MIRVKGLLSRQRATEVLMLRVAAPTVLCAVCALCSFACSKASAANSGGGGESSSSTGGSSSGTAGTAGAGTSAAGTSGTAGSAGTTAVTGGDCPDVGLPKAAALANVVALVDGNTARIRFDPADNAKDYRVYVLPKASDVSGSAIANATYRCTGTYPIPIPRRDNDNTGGAIKTVVNGTVQGYARTSADATLGYVYSTPGAGRLPVYALGESAPNADNVVCYEPRFPESRIKTYTTSETQRTTLLDKHFRDDGIAFYVPAKGTTGTIPVYRAEDPTAQYDGPLYVTGQEYQARLADKSKQISEAFSILSQAAPDTVPLMRVQYEQECARSHDELVVTEGRFNKAVNQGGTPVLELHASGLSANTTLVVEALDAECPFQGVVSPMARPARDDPFNGYTVSYPAFLTPDQVRAASPTHEVFLNGQGDGTTPHAIARACITVSPKTAPPLDFHYDGTPETLSPEKQAGFQIWTSDSKTFDYQIHTIATNEWGIGGQFGELWLTYADWASDTNGKMRITPKQTTTISSSSYLYATMNVDMVSSGRRYPQILISDQLNPVQDNLPKGDTVIVQSRGGITSPMVVDMQFCDHRTWDVNNQCPQWETYLMNGGAFLAARPEINGFMGGDETVKFEVYASTGKVYLFTNGLPYGCAEIPPNTFKDGVATVTFGDVLYHSGVDLAPWYPFYLAHLHTQTTRHFSNLGFKAGVGAPEWNETRMPCAPASTLK